MDLLFHIPPVYYIKRHRFLPLCSLFRLGCSIPTPRGANAVILLSDVIFSSIVGLRVSLDSSQGLCEYRTASSATLDTFFDLAPYPQTDGICGFSYILWWQRADQKELEIKPRQMFGNPKSPKSYTYYAELLTIKSEGRVKMSQKADILRHCRSSGEINNTPSMPHNTSVWYTPWSGKGSSTGEEIKEKRPPLFYLRRLLI